MAGIYIHIPFCRQACNYCSFHFSTTLKSKSRLVAALVHEISQRTEESSDHFFESIYLGGGTPSILTREELIAIFKALKDHYKISSTAEITLEANPEDITEDKLKHWYELGINRLSVGIQSFIDKDLKYMNRAHNAQQSHEALQLIQKSPFQNINGDLMFGLIDSTLKDWELNLTSIAAYDLNHLSIYNLTIEEQTVFANWKMKNKLTEIPNELQHEQFKYASRFLTTLGYDHYEISNYAKTGHHAVHNTNYWKKIPYLGFGPSAHTYDGHSRSWNIANNAKYIKLFEQKKYNRTFEELKQREKYNETIMLGLRTKWGIPKKDIEQFSDKIQHYFKKGAERLKAQKVIVEKEGHILLDRSQWYVSDLIASELFIV